MSGDGDDYEIGYGKPPKRTQFKKGQSGNKKGRPKDSNYFNTDLGEVLRAPVTVTENGKPKIVSTQMVILLKLKEKAMKGDARAMDLFVVLAQQLSEEKEGRSAERKLSADEEAILERFEADLVARAANGDAADPEDETDDT